MQIESAKTRLRIHSNLHQSIFTFNCSYCYIFQNLQSNNYFWACTVQKMTKRRGTCAMPSISYGKMATFECMIVIFFWYRRTEQRTISHPLQQTTPHEKNTQNSINDALSNSSYSHRNYIDDPITDHIPDPILQNSPPTFPNIFYKPADVQAVINWKTALAIKLTDLSNAQHLSNLETTQQLLTEIYHTPHLEWFYQT